MSFSPPETSCRQLPLRCQVPTRRHIPHIRKFTSLFRDLCALDESDIALLPLSIGLQPQRWLD